MIGDKDEQFNPINIDVLAVSQSCLDINAIRWLPSSNGIGPGLALGQPGNCNSSAHSSSMLSKMHHDATHPPRAFPFDGRNSVQDLPDRHHLSEVASLTVDR